jgi:LacI family transcriptional regulator
MSARNPPAARSKKASLSAEAPRRRPTINDVARMAEVSKKTVSRVINRSPAVSPETRLRVEKVISESGFAPDPQARGLAFRRSFLIGLAFDNPNPQYIVNMQTGMLDGLRGSGFELVVHPCNRASPSFMDDLRGFVERQRLFGVVLTPSMSEDARIPELLASVGSSYVRVASVLLDAPEKMIVTHDREGALLVGEHFAELGHKDIALVTGPATFRSSVERRGGLEAGLARHGLTLAEKFVMQGDYTFASGVTAGEKLFALKPRPTAIFATNDEMAAGVLQAGRLAGLEAPRDFSIVGFDDFDIATKVWPPLTTVRSATRDFGRMAAEKLIGAQSAPADVSMRLVTRSSTGKAPR